VFIFDLAEESLNLWQSTAKNDAHEVVNVLAQVQQLSRQWAPSYAGTSNALVHVYTGNEQQYRASHRYTLNLFKPTFLPEVKNIGGQNCSKNLFENKSHPLLYTVKNSLGYLKARIVRNKVLGENRNKCSFFLHPLQPPLLVFADERRAD